MDDSLRIELQNNIYSCAITNKKLWSLPESKVMVKKYSKELNELNVLQEVFDYIEEEKIQLKKLGYDADDLCKINEATLKFIIGCLALHNDRQMFDGLWSQLCK